MVQNAIRPTEIAHPVQPHLEIHQGEAARRNTIETIACPICQAVYAPAPQHVAFLAFSPRAMEAAFMQTCHFCFRCRRTACPLCWDFVQGVCAECDQEAGLPFRVEAPPLAGLRFPPPRLTSHYPQEEIESSFVCLHTGRFQTQPSLLPLPQYPASGLTARTEYLLPNVEASAFSFPQEAAVWELQRPPVIGSETDDEEDEDDEDELDEKIGLWEHIEHALVVSTVLALLTVIVMIVLAELQPNVNAQIISFAHIDIRAEIAYLLQLVGHIFKR
jgi:hypothetical protein